MYLRNVLSTSQRWPSTPPPSSPHTSIACSGTSAGPSDRRARAISSGRLRAGEPRDRFPSRRKKRCGPGCFRSPGTSRSITIAYGCGAPSHRRWRKKASRLATQDVDLAVNEALATLPDLDRDVFLMREVVGLGYHEIGQACGLTPDAVRSRMGGVGCNSASDWRLPSPRGEQFPCGTLAARRESESHE